MQFWELRNAVAETYRAGRIFIAGDAAHSHPPYGGFELNNGLEDAINLGWKLAAVLQGWGGEGLLASFSAERQPVFRDVAEDFIAARIAADASFLKANNPERDRAGFERAWAARQGDLGERVQSYEPNYEGSSVVAGPFGGKSSAHGTHSFAARAGHHLSPRPLSTGRNVFEQLGRGFSLLAFDVGENGIAAFRVAAAALSLPLTVIEDTRREAREAYGASLILVRPDQFVAWSGDKAPADVAGLLRRVTGR